MPEQTYSITAPNGKMLDVTGDHVPTESELRDIFKQAGVDTGSDAAVKKADAFVPRTATEFFGRMGKAALDVPIGAAKNFGRAVQMIPGVSAGTDKLYGLPAGTSEQAMQPSNTTQTAGGYVGDAALVAATGGASTEGQVWSKLHGWIDDPTVAQRAGAAIRNTTAAIRAELSSGGPVTAEKVASAIVKYGKEAVKAAIVTAGGYGTWRAVRHLF